LPQNDKQPFGSIILNHSSSIIHQRSVLCHLSSLLAQPSPAPQ